jgi:hypothetical protein
MNFMGSRTPSLRSGIVALALFFIGTFFVGSQPAAHGYSTANAKPAGACMAPEYREFDFWAGDWDAFDVGGGPAKVARARVESILDGCVLLETYEGTDQHKGESFTIYDASRKVWHQSWVTNRGQLLVIEGKKQGDGIVLSGVDHAKVGGERQVRGTWTPDSGGVRETAVISTDGGVTWVPWFDIVFRPHKP